MSNDQKKKNKKKVQKPMDVYVESDGFFDLKPYTKKKNKNS